MTDPVTNPGPARRRSRRGGRGSRGGAGRKKRRAVTAPAPATFANESSEDDNSSSEVESSDTDVARVTLVKQLPEFIEAAKTSDTKETGNVKTDSTKIEQPHETAPPSDAESSDTDGGGASLLEHPDPSGNVNFSADATVIRRPNTRPSIFTLIDDDEDSSDNDEDNEKTPMPEQATLVNEPSAGDQRQPTAKFPSGDKICIMNGTSPIATSKSDSKSEYISKGHKEPVASGDNKYFPNRYEPISAGKNENTSKGYTEYVPNGNNWSAPIGKSASNLDGADDGRASRGSTTTVTSLPSRPATRNDNGRNKPRHRGWNPKPVDEAPAMAPLNVGRQRMQIARETATKSTRDAYGRPIEGEYLRVKHNDEVPAKTQSTLSALAKTFRGAPQGLLAADPANASNLSPGVRSPNLGLVGSFIPPEDPMQPVQLHSPAGAPPMLSPIVGQQTTVPSGSPLRVPADKAASVHTPSPKKPERSPERISAGKNMLAVISPAIMRRSLQSAEKGLANVAALNASTEHQNMLAAMQPHASTNPDVQKEMAKYAEMQKQFAALQSEMAAQAKLIPSASAGSSFQATTPTTQAATLIPSASAGSSIQAMTPTTQAATLRYENQVRGDFTATVLAVNGGTWQGIKAEPGHVLTTKGQIQLNPNFSPPEVGKQYPAGYVPIASPSLPASDSLSSILTNEGGKLAFRNSLVPSPSAGSIHAASPGPVGANGQASLGMTSPALITAQPQVDPFVSGNNGAASPANQLMVVEPSMLEVRATRSPMLNALVPESGVPTIENLLSEDFFPFVQSTDLHPQPVLRGIVKLKNIPFGTTRTEVIAFMGKNSKILNDNEEPVHIIMCRVTSKTLDAYVEFVSPQDALLAVEKFTRQTIKCRAPRLGDRPIDVELSDQAALMSDLFPYARGLRWNGPEPVLVAPEPDTMPGQYFKGFVNAEEMVMLVKHVECPHRSPFAQNCPQRPYESMISTLKKFPWHKSGMFTIRERQSIYDATIKLIALLQAALKNPHKKCPENLDERLLKRLVVAGMLCAGFTPIQKDNIAFQAGLPQDEIMKFNMPRFADQWLHAWTLAPKPNTPLDVLEWYIAVIREETTRAMNQLPMFDRTGIVKMGKATDGYWGYFWHETNFYMHKGFAFDNMVLAAVGRHEMGTIEQILIRFCQRSAAVAAQNLQQAMQASPQKAILASPQKAIEQAAATPGT